MNGPPSSLEKAGAWWVSRLLEKLVMRHYSEVWMKRYIKRSALYSDFSKLYHFSRDETRAALNLLRDCCPGVVFSGQGLLIPRVYGDPKKRIEILFGPPLARVEVSDVVIAGPAALGVRPLTEFPRPSPSTS